MRQAGFRAVSAIPLIVVAAVLSFPAGDTSSVATAIEGLRRAF